MLSISPSREIIYNSPEEKEKAKKRKASDHPGKIDRKEKDNDISTAYKDTAPRSCSLQSRDSRLSARDRCIDQSIESVVFDLVECN